MLTSLPEILGVLTDIKIIDDSNAGGKHALLARVKCSMYIVVVMHEGFATEDNPVLQDFKCLVF